MENNSLACHSAGLDLDDVPHVYANAFVRHVKWPNEPLGSVFVISKRSHIAISIIDVQCIICHVGFLKQVV